MSRLTKGSEKHNDKFVSYVADVSLYPEMMGYEQTQAEMDAINKLGQLEDLEAELGIDLITLFKALKYGIYFVENDFETNNKEVNFAKRPRLYYSDDFKCWCFEMLLGVYRVKLKDYGKTWALSKNDLEEKDDE